jgi:hypothetical protein
MQLVDISRLYKGQHLLEILLEKKYTSSALKTSNAACSPDRAPSHCSALGSFGLKKRWKIYSEFDPSL